MFEQGKTKKGIKCIVKHTVKILKNGTIFSCFAFANSSAYCDMWLSCLSRATTQHPSRFSKSTWYIFLYPLYKLIFYFIKTLFVVPY